MRRQRPDGTYEWLGRGAAVPRGQLLPNGRHTRGGPPVDNTVRLGAPPSLTSQETPHTEEKR